MKKVSLLTDYIAHKASTSNRVLAILVAILILNFVIPDTLPFVDELISVPIILAITAKLFGDAKRHDSKKHKHSSQKTKDDIPREETVIDGEIVD